jgi:hypothetical protein
MRVSMCYQTGSTPASPFYASHNSLAILYLDRNTHPSIPFSFPRPSTTFVFSTSFRCASNPDFISRYLFAQTASLRLGSCCICDIACGAFRFSLVLQSFRDQLLFTHCFRLLCTRWHPCVI